MKEPLETIVQPIMDLPDDLLGDLFRAYIGESIHAGMEGFSSRDLTGIRRLLTDMVLYHKNCK